MEHHPDDVKLSKILSKSVNATKISLKNTGSVVIVMNFGPEWRDDRVSAVCPFVRVSVTGAVFKSAGARGGSEHLDTATGGKI